MSPDEIAMHLDRRVSRERPDLTYYLRPVVEGEFAPVPLPALLPGCVFVVRVLLLGPGVRARQLEPHSRIAEEDRVWFESTRAEIERLSRLS